MPDVKITVLKRLCIQDLIDDYGAKGISSCDLHKEGEVFISKGGKRPSGFCVEAWSSFEKYVFALAHGADGFWKTWINQDGISINSCNDGLRPVIFKLETINEE